MRPSNLGVVVLAGLGLLPGCAAPVETPPLPDSLMVEVLADLHVAGARIRLEPDVTPGLRDSVLAAHGLDSLRFASATAWFKEHPDAFLAVYGAVVDRLNERQAP